MKALIWFILVPGFQWQCPQLPVHPRGSSPQNFKNGETAQFSAPPQALASRQICFPMGGSLRKSHCCYCFHSLTNLFALCYSLFLCLWLVVYLDTLYASVKITHPLSVHLLVLLFSQKCLHIVWHFVLNHFVWVKKKCALSWHWSALPNAVFSTIARYCLSTLLLLVFIFTIIYVINLNLKFCFIWFTTRQKTS